MADNPEKIKQIMKAGLLPVFFVEGAVHALAALGGVMNVFGSGPDQFSHLRFLLDHGEPDILMVSLGAGALMVIAQQAKTFCESRNY